MASNIPITRRTTRITRTATQLGSENIESRKTHGTRSQSQLAKQSGLATTSTSRLTAATVASKAKTNTKVSTEKPGTAKRREALAEIAVSRNTTKVADARSSNDKGKAKEVLVPAPRRDAPKPKTTQTQRPPDSTAVQASLPLRTTRNSTRNSFETASELPQANIGAQGLDKTAKAPSHAFKQRSPVFKPPPPKETAVVSSSRFPAAPVKRSQDEDPETNRAIKKRHTSPPEEREVTANDDSQLEADAVAAHLAGPLEPQADNELWDDLDAEDWDDPVMASEYIHEIFDYFKETEAQTLPTANYINAQPELVWEHRAVIIDWVIQVHSSFRLLPESLFLAINVFDRFLSARVIALKKVQLVAVTALLIACKSEETLCPSISDLVLLGSGAYNSAEVIKAERFILKVLEFNLSYPNPMNFLRRASKADGLEINARTVAKYLLEVCCMEWKLVGTPPSLWAAASLWLGRLVFGREEWTHNLAHYSGYSEAEVLPVVNIILNHLVAPIAHESLFSKYASKRYSKVSVLLREWALHRWDEGSQISLLHDLPELKREAVEFRHRLEKEERELEAEETRRAAQGTHRRSRH